MVGGEIDINSFPIILTYFFSINFPLILRNVASTLEPIEQQIMYHKFEQRKIDNLHSPSGRSSSRYTVSHHERKNLFQAILPTRINRTLEPVYRLTSSIHRCRFKKVARLVISYTETREKKNYCIQYEFRTILRLTNNFSVVRHMFRLL